MYALMPTVSGKCVQGCVKERETGERSEVTGLRGYAVTAVAVASARPSPSFVPDIVTLLKQGRTRKKKKKNGDENEKRH